MAREPATLEAHDGLPLALHRWPLDAPAGVCLLVHGYAEHAGRFDGFARALGGVGIETFAVDLRGHGRSGGTRADVGDFGDYVRDVAALRAHVDRLRPDLPVLLFGHSMGGAVALRAALESPDAQNALVLSAPFLRPTQPPPGWLTGLSAGLARWLPQLPVQPLDASALSRDPAVVKAYRDDPYTYTGFVKARMGHALITAGAPLLGRADALAVPTLIVHGTADALADPRASEELSRRVPSDRVTLRLYDGAYHELLNDLDRDTVLDDILTWVRAQPPFSAPERATPGT